MKKLILILILLITTIGYAQKPKVDAVRYKEVTTAQRNSFVVPNGEHWKIYNVTTAQFEYWDGDSWEVFTGGSGGTTDHTALSNIGTNTHPQIDTHIANSTIHYPQNSISITESQISDLTHTIDTDDQTASEVPFTPNGSIAATNVQAAFQEVRDEALGGAVDSVNGQTGVVSLDAADIGVSKIGTPTYDNLQHVMNLFGSPGRFSGGTITDAGTATINVSAVTGAIKATDSDVAELMFFDVTGVSGIAIPSNTTRYIGVEYNSGTPQIVSRTTSNFDYDTDFPLGQVTNEGGVLHIINNPWWTGDALTNIIERLQSSGNIARDERIGGLTLGETGTRNVTLSAGILWSVLSEFIIDEINTSTTGDFTTEYRNGSGGWTTTTGVTQYPNTLYDDGDGGLATMTNNYYANLWFYVEVDGDLVMLYPQAQYSNVVNAESEAVPNIIPDRLKETGILVGRIIFKKSENTAEDIESAFRLAFATTLSSDHNNLAGIQGGTVGEYNHLTNAELAQIANIPTLTDDDTMVSATSTNVPSGESIKAYVDATATGLVLGNGASTPTLQRVTVGGETNWDTGNPISDSHQLTANGTVLEEGLDYTVAGTVITFEAAYLPIGVERQQFWNNVSAVLDTETIQIACGDLVTNITTGTSKAYLRMPFAATLTDVRCSLFDAGTVTGLTVDINENGVSVLSTLLTTDATEKTSTTATTAAVISDSALADDAEITIDFDVIPTAGKGVIITLELTRL